MNRMLQGPRSRVQTVVAVDLLVATSLVVMSSLHLTGQLTGRSAPFDAEHAGIAEASIAVILTVGMLVTLREPVRRGMAGVVAIALAIVGFLNGLSMTVQGGHVTDIVYHLVVLPVLLWSLVVMYNARRRLVRDAAPDTRLGSPSS